jgi:hypothetical protein
MSEHYPKGTISVRKWCGPCRKETEHSVADGRLGRCINDHYPPKPVKAAPVPSTQTDLFGKTSA